MAQPFRALRRCSPWSPLGLWGSGCSECPDLQCFHISISPYSMDLMVFRSSDLGQIWDLGISGSRGSLDPRIWGHPGITRIRVSPGLDIPVHSVYSALSLGMATWPYEGYSAWSRDGPWGPPRRASKGPIWTPFGTPFGPNVNVIALDRGVSGPGTCFGPLLDPFGPIWALLGCIGSRGPRLDPFGGSGVAHQRAPFEALWGPFQPYLNYSLEAIY